MLLLLSLFLLFYQANDLHTARMSPAVFSAIKQGPIKEPGCIPLFSREMTFKIKNRSDKAIYIHGVQTERGYFPFGNLLRHLGQSDEWVDREGHSAPPDKEVKFVADDVYVLPPGKSMKFNDVAEDVYIGGTVKRGIYVSYSPDEKPRLLMSEEFVLR
jgi:hypothetical protein